MLSQYVPVTQPISQPDGSTWFRFLDRDTIRFLFSYMWYSVLDQYVRFTEIEMESEFKAKTARRGEVKASKNLVGETKMKQTVADFLLVFIRVVEEDKDRVNISYDELMKKVYRDRDLEKRGMMRQFENAANADLKYMNMEKRFKIGRWLMEDVHKYKKDRYNQEIQEMLMQQLEAEGALPEKEGETFEKQNTEFYAEEHQQGPIDDLDDMEDDLFGEYEEDRDMFDKDRDYESDFENDFDYDN